MKRCLRQILSMCMAILLISCMLTPSVLAVEDDSIELTIENGPNELPRQDETSSEDEAMDAGYVVPNEYLSTVSSGTCGANLVWRLDDDGTLTISGNGTMKNFGYLFAPWYGKRSSIKQVIVQEGVESIGSYAFFGHSQLSTISLPQTLRSIEDDAFAGCTSLQDIAFPKEISKIGEYSFYDCCSLTSIVLPENITIIPRAAFDLCKGLKQVVILGPVTAIEQSAFYFCVSLELINYPDTLIDIGENSFHYCTSLHEVTIPSSIHNIGENAFSDCKNIQEVYYIGTADEWNNITIGSGNSYLVNAYFHYGSGSQAGSITALDYSLSHVYYDYGIKHVDLLNTAITIDTTHGPFSLSPEFDGTCRPACLRLYSGDKEIGMSVDGAFKDIDPHKMISGAPLEIEMIDVFNSTQKKVTLLLNVANGDSKKVVSSLSFGSNISYTIPKDVPLMGGKQLEMSLPVDLPVSVVWDRDAGKVRVGVNLEERVLSGEVDSIPSKPSTETVFHREKTFSQKWDSFLKDVKLANEYGKKIDMSKDGIIGSYLAKSDAEVSGKLPGFSKKTKFTIVGYGEADYSDSLEKITIDLVVAFSGSETWQTQTVVWVVPVTVNCTISGSATATTQGGYDFVQNEWLFNLKLSLKAAIEPYAGIGVGRVLSVGVYGKAQLGSDITLMDLNHEWPTLNEVTLYGETGVKGYFALKEVKASILNTKDAKEIPTLTPYINDSGKIYIYSRTAKSILGDLFPSSTKTASSSVAVMTMEEIYSKPEEYFSSYSALIGTEQLDGGSDTLITNAYPDARPQLVKAGDTTLLIYVGIDDNRSGDNRTILKYMVFDEESKSFSPSAAVWDDGTADCNPVVYTDGEAIYVAYLNANQVFFGEAELDKYAAAFGISVAMYDAESGSFSDLGRINQNNCYTYQPSLTATDDGLLAMWVENEDNNVFGATGNNTIYTAQLSNGSWSEPVILADSLNAVTNVAVGVLNGNIYTAYSVDNDGDLTTTESTLTLRDSNGSIIATTNGAVYDMHFAKLSDSNAPALIVNMDGSLCRIDENTGTTETLLSASGMTTFQADDGEIYYLSTTEDNRNIYRAHLVNGEWVSICLTDENGYIDSFSSLNGDPVYLVQYVDVSDSELPSTSVIKFRKELSVHDISLLETEYDYEELEAGKDFRLGLVVANNGTEKITEMTATLTPKDGSDSMSQTISVDIASGVQEEVEFIFTLPATFTGTDYNVSICESNYADKDLSDNSAELEFSKTDLVTDLAYVVTQEGRFAQVTVTNSSAVESTGTTVITDKDGTSILTQTKQLTPKESIVYTVELTSKQISGEEATVTAVTTCDKDEHDTTNNSSCQIVWDVSPSTSTVHFDYLGDVNCDKIIDLKDVSLLFRFETRPEDHKISELGKLQGDMDGNDKLNLRDVAAIFHFANQDDIR